MGWANCGEDSKGRPIGYAHAATCDHDGCDEQINRGLAFACGGMHGEFDAACDGYFCEKHRIGGVEMSDGEVTTLCLSCFEHAERDGLLSDDN